MKRFPRAITIPGPSCLTRRSCEAASSLGVLLEPTPPSRVSVDPRLVTEILRARAGTITLVSGPSGSGKTALMGAIRAALGAGDERVIEAGRRRPAPRPLVDLFAGPVDRALAALARAGLGEARIALRTPAELSVGQRARLDLALALDRAGDRAALLVDEFGSSLDAPTTRTLSATLRRFVSDRPGLRAFVATTRDDAAQWLAPDRAVTLDLLGAAVLGSRPDDSPGPSGAAAGLVIEPSDLSRALPLLGLHHYRPAQPARVARVLCARDHESGQTVGALVVAMPTLNARWRDLAWPDRFSVGSPGARARRLNAELRRIARVVVDPRWRGAGVATALVRAYLDRPLTPLTEAVSAMGRSTRCFTNAGMRPIPLAPPERHARLLDALERCSVEPWRLATPGTALRRAIDGAGRPFVERETRRWAGASRAARRFADAPLEVVFREACRAIAVEQIAFVT